MAVDTSSVNLLHIIPGTFRKVASTGGGEYHGACPFCGGTDRFIIHPYANPPRWWCRRDDCGKKGDAIAFKQQYHNLSFVDAMKALNLESQLSRSRAASKTIHFPTTKNIAHRPC